MAKVFGVLGQAAPTAGVLTTAYTVPASRHATARVLVSNRGAASTFRVALSPAGAAIANAHYIAYDVDIAARDAVSSVPFAITATDVVRVYSSGNNLSFTVTGIEDDN